MESDRLERGSLGVRARPFAVDGHHPLPGLRMPKQPWIPTLVFVFDDRVALEFLPGCAIVMRIRDAFAATGAGKGDDHRWPAILSPAGGIVVIDDAAAGKRKIILAVGIERDRQLLPVNQIGADRMPPMHVAPFDSIGV